MNPSTNQDILCLDSLREALGDDGAEISLRVFREIDSTNSEAKRLAADGASAPALIVAESQTAGRGRMGRSFYSPAQTGVYFSFLYQAASPLENAVTVTGAASVAVMRAIRALCGRQTQIKWVNDLYLDGKKVCGILAEAVSIANAAPQVIVGIGINLRTADFPPELTQKAGSVGAEKTVRAELIAAVWRELKPFLCDPFDISWLSDYRAHSCVIGKPITWTRAGETFSGLAVGIDDSGALEVRLPDGTADYLRTGEISVTVDRG